jgi:hypothetical protein
MGTSFAHSLDALPLFRAYRARFVAIWTIVL